MNTGTIVIRRIEAHEWPLLCELSALDGEAFPGDGLTPTQLALFARGGLLQAVLDNGQVVAAAFLLAVPGTRTALLFSLAVRAAHRRAGHGRTLLADVERDLRERGFEEIELTVAPDNTPARRLYQEVFGFREAGRLPDFFGPGQDRLLLRKRLTPAAESGRKPEGNGPHD